MYFATLASGSSGNSIIVGEENRNFLVDCGITVKRLLANLDMINMSALQIEGIIVTHEHSDHIKGVGALARRLKIPIYATYGLWDEMEKSLGALKPEQRVIITEDVTLAGMHIQLVPTSHDSRESYGLKITGKKHTLAIATDSGIVTPEMSTSLRGCDAYVVEANHDPEMLKRGKYPWYLKKRINSQFGHLSNIQLGEALGEWLLENAQKVVLAHLSAENNTPQLALHTVINMLRKSEARHRCPQLRIRVAPRYVPHDLIILEG
ncbi:MAG: MBL fold metallo-hydrolase [Peptococcaceae bacterium]|nr:MBL fold metallo-hydrolase [Peptococcaceae bacterium]